MERPLILVTNDDGIESEGLWAAVEVVLPLQKAAPLVFLLAPWDKTVRQAARTWLGDVLRHPGRLFDGVRFQTIGIIQAPDIQPNGQADMCDSCPDMTYWNGQLINSCRMDEYRLFGDMLSVAQKSQVETMPLPLTLESEARIPENREQVLASEMS